MRFFLRAPGVLTAPLGDAWVVYSGLSGESHLVNDESLAVVDALDELQPRSTPDVSATLAAECGMPSTVIDATLAPSWGSLLESGLIREHFNTASGGL